MPAEGAGKYRRFLDPANIVLTVAVAVALAFMVYMSRKIIVISQDNQVLTAEVARFAQLEVGDLVPALSARDLAGLPARIEFNTGQKHLLFIFSANCAACARQLPVWTQLAPQAKSAGCVVHGISVDSPDETKAYFNGEDSIPTLILPVETFKRAYRVREVPQTVLLSDQGVVEWVHAGMLSEDEIRELLSKARAGEVARND
jgi:peroxiredoxin